MEPAASTHQAARVHDLELESVPLGPHTRMTLLAADDQGCVTYVAGRRHRQQIPLTRAHARLPLLLIDAGRWALLLEPKTRRLEAMTFFSGATCRTILFGTHWGTWINELGGEARAISIPELILRWDLPVALHEERQTLAFEFPVNIYNREVFIPAGQIGFKDGVVRHILELHFGYPLGGFRQARLRLEDEPTDRVVECIDLEGFPLAVPEKPARLPDPPPPPRPAAEPPKAQPATPPRPEAPKPAYPFQSTLRGKDAPRSPRLRPQAPPHAQPHPAERPIPRTELLPLSEMLTVVATEANPERRWKILEANLGLGRPERTYPLIARYGELIGEQAAQWTPARLKTVFAGQPGAVLIGIMESWSVNQVLAVAEGAGEQPIMEWLREREIERLLKLDLSHDPATVESARRALRVDKYADAAMVKKVWRLQLGFMNADHGRSEERAIHRKKDEIAKLLQVARNTLLQHL